MNDNSMETTARTDAERTDDIFRDEMQDKGDAVIVDADATKHTDTNDGIDHDKAHESKKMAVADSEIDDSLVDTDIIDDEAVVSYVEKEQTTPTPFLAAPKAASTSIATARKSTVMTLPDIASMNSFDSTALQENINDLTVNTTHPKSTTRNTSSITSVTSERKEQLLLQARYDRIEWIHKIPLPYNKNCPFTKSTATHATFHLPTVHKVVQYLYGQTAYDVDAHLSEQVSQNPTKTPSNDHSAPRNQNIHRLNGQQIIDYEIQQLSTVEGGANTLPSSDAIMNTKVLLLQYQKFIQTLEDPSTAAIVQKLRSYIRQLYATVSNNIVNTAKNDQSIGDDDQNNVENVTTATIKFQSYINSIYDTILHHPSFMACLVDGMNTDDSNSNVNGHHLNDQLQALLRRCYDSFVYGHCYSYFDTLFNTNDVREKGKQFQKNVQFLSSFVTPVHLDIHCFVSRIVEPKHTDEDTSRVNEDYLKELLSNSISLLKSIDIYYSPYEKLQRILLLYHEINIALKSATTSTTKLPSADDILPTFIYVILLASSEQNQNSCNLYYNLYYIEQLLTPTSFKNNDTSTANNHSSSIGNSNHYLRGEAGYAYTNLYSAYQFISDFETTSIASPFDGTSSAMQIVATDVSPPPSLSISKEAWKTAIESYQVKAQERYDAIQTASTTTETLLIDTYEPNLSIGLYSTDTTFDSPVLHTPSPMDIRQARLRGETIDLNWAIQRQRTQDQRQQYESPLLTQKSVFEQVEESLPHGFQRNYNFINVRTVDDLKYNDVEQLLQEYHTLVRTTETLLSERARQITRERKFQQVQKEKALLEQQQQHQQTLLFLNSNELDRST